MRHPDISWYMCYDCVMMANKKDFLSLHPQLDRVLLDITSIATEDGSTTPSILGTIFPHAPLLTPGVDKKQPNALFIVSNKCRCSISGLYGIYLF